MNDLKEKEYAVVTGASSGIGKCVSELLLSKGIVVFALDVKPVALNDVVPIACNVSSESDLNAALLRILDVTRKIDYLVLSAGILCRDSRYLIEEMPLDEWTTVLNTNMTGLMLSLRTFIPLLKNNRKGR